jgi:hypothetical protein
MTRRQITLEQAARNVVAALVDALGDSTWREHHPGAYTELLDYVLDMKQTVVEVLSGAEIFE